MTQHEFLAFLTGLHQYIEKSVSNPGPWCWPTRELLLHNLNLNRERLSESPRSMSAQFGHMLPRLRGKAWIVVGGCTDHCHAEHVRVTDAGLEALALMDEYVCGEVLGRGAPKFPCAHAFDARLHRKLAA